MTAEQKARDMLTRAGVELAHTYTAGNLVEIANMIVANEALRGALERFTKVADAYLTEWSPPGGYALDAELLNAKKVLQETKTVV